MLIALVVVLNLFSFSIYGIDKFKAKRNLYRISENFLLLAAFFAPYGAYLGMQVFHHKTQKAKFKYVVPIFILVNVISLFYIFK